MMSNVTLTMGSPAESWRRTSPVLVPNNNSRPFGDHCSISTSQHHNRQLTSNTTVYINVKVLDMSVGVELTLVSRQSAMHFQLTAVVPRIVL